MQQGMIECKYCGAPLETAAAVGSVIECSYCHRKHIVAKSENKNAVHYLEMGEHDLDSCNFDAAFVAYQKAAEYDGNEPEAYFGMALAEFGVQYIKDSVNGRLQAICHDVSNKTFADNKNYKQALKCATNEQQQEYKKRAEEIDYIRGEFFKLKNSGLDYDCFICVKVTGESGKTKDYKTADDLYFHLRGKGYNPFFSEREISNRTGVDYEAFILYALHSSECMIVVCSDESYLSTPWVKNEYTRFCELVADKQKESDSITIVFDGSPIERLPGRTGRIQGVDIRKADAYGKIVEYVDSHTPEAKARRQKAIADKKAEEEKLKQQLAEQAELQAKQLEEFKAQQERARMELESKLAAMQAAPVMPQGGATIIQQGGASAGSLLIRVKQFLSSGDFNNAESYCNRVLDMEPENADAWFLLLLAKLKIADHDDSISQIINGIKTSTDIAELLKRPAYINASRYARGSKDFIALDSALNELYKELSRKEEQERIERERRAEQERIERERAEEQERIEREHAEEIRRQEELLRATFDIKDGVLLEYKKNESYAVIPFGVKSIHDKAFGYCSKLKKVSIPNSVTSIGNEAFENCSSLTSIEIPNSVMSIGYSAFDGCISLTSIEIPNSVTSIGDSTFHDCSSLKNINIPNSVTSIGDSVFEKCISLTSIEIPNSVTSIGGSAFDGCSNLTSIEIPNSVTRIGEWAFYDCISLTSIEIPNSVTSIWGNAFRNCSSLVSIEIPNSVTSIGEWAFFGCSKLTSIEIPNSVTSIGEWAFSSCSKLTSIEIPNSVTSIGDGAFSYCISLTSIEIPNSVTSIGNSAFSGCSKLTSIEIPNSVTNIGDSAFAYCKNLQEITIPKRFKSRIGKIFDGVDAVKGLFKKAKINYT